MTTPRAEFRDSLKPLVPRLEHCCARLAPYAADRSFPVATAFAKAGRVLGVSGDRARDMARSIGKRGSVDGYLAWLAEPPALSEPRIGELPTDAVGWVYTATLREHPHIIKIGFSGQPEVRMGQLTHETGCRHELLEVRIGTLVDEALAHLAARRRRVAREWFFIDGQHDWHIPDFLLSGLDRATVDAWSEQRRSAA